MVYVSPTHRFQWGGGGGQILNHCYLTFFKSRNLESNIEHLAEPRYLKSTNFRISGNPVKNWWNLWVPWKPG